MIRKDVYKIAETLNAGSGIGVEALYAWLMVVGKDKSKNPRLLTFVARPGIVWLDGERDTTYLEQFQPKVNAVHDCAKADYWENRILERQEYYMD